MDHRVVCGESPNVLDESGEAYEHLTEEEFQTLLADMSDLMTIRIEVTYALPDEQVIKELQVPRGHHP